jgi:hypothetical protein
MMSEMVRVAEVQAAARQSSMEIQQVGFIENTMDDAFV